MERARRIDPDVAAVHLAQAGIYAVQDSLKAEAQALRQALKLQPSHALAKARLADNLRRRGQHTQAVRMAREAVRLDPRQPQALEMMGHQLLVVGLYSRAEAWYRHILNIEPGYWTAYENLAFTELNRGRPDRALQMWREYFRQTDSRPSLALFFATNTALAADRPDQARKYLQQIYPEAYAKTPPDFSIGRASQPSSETSVIPPGSGVLAGFIERQIGNEKLGRRVLKEAVDGLRESLERDESLRRPYRTWLAGGLAVLGRTEEAIREVERVAEEPTGAGWLRWYPLLDTLRTEPRFQDVIRRLDARRQKAREGVLQLGIDLYPPGTKSDSGVSRAPNS